MKDARRGKPVSDQLRHAFPCEPGRARPGARRLGKSKAVAGRQGRAVGDRILMTTDPGDLVLDPTCGSGTTAYVAEQWGRRWITIDTSRVALALARTRLMAARYPWYLLADSPLRRPSPGSRRCRAAGRRVSWRGPQSDRRPRRPAPARSSLGQLALLQPASSTEIAGE